MKDKIRIQFYKVLSCFLAVIITVSGTGISAVALETPIIPIIKSMSVTYYLNRGSGEIPTESKKSKGEIFAAAGINGIIPPEGKQFKEWNTKSNGSGTGYTPGAMITMPNESLTLYAMWEEVSGITIETTGIKNSIPFIVEGKAIGGSKVGLEITGVNYSANISNIRIQSDGTWFYNFNDSKCRGEISITAYLLDNGGDILSSAVSAITIPYITIDPVNSEPSIPFVLKGKGIGGSKVMLKIIGDNYSTSKHNINIQPDGTWSYNFEDEQCRGEISIFAYLLDGGGNTIASTASNLMLPYIMMEPINPKETIPFAVKGKAIGGSKVKLRITGDNYSSEISNINIQSDGTWFYNLTDEACKGEVSIFAYLMDFEGHTLISVSSTIVIPYITMKPLSSKMSLPFVMEGKAVGGSKVNAKIVGDNYPADMIEIDIQGDGTWSYVVDREECTGRISVIANLVDEEGKTLASTSSAAYILEDNPYELVGNVLWAFDDAVESHHGIRGNRFNTSFGDLKTQNYNQGTIGWFFEWGDSNIIKECISGLDNAEDTDYNGYLDITVNAPKDLDDYILNILCFGEEDRLYEITVNGESQGNTETMSTNASDDLTYTTRVGSILNVLQMVISLEQGENIIRLQAPKGYKAPVFVAAAVIHLEMEKMDSPLTSLEPGNYEGAQRITLTAEEDSKIYYTKDGTTPTEESLLFTLPILLPEGKTTILKAIAIKEGFRKSDVAVFQYIVDYEKVTVTYETGEGGKITGEKVQRIVKGSDTKEVMAEPEAGYIFVKWQDSKTESVRKETNVQQDMTVIAEFARKPIHRITLDPDGGTGVEEAIEVIDGETVGSLPIPVRSDYEFVGWYDSKTEGTKITNETIATKSMTIYARWEKEPLAEVQVKYEALEGGTIEGNEIQVITLGEDTEEVTAVPESGYAFLQWNDGETAVTRKETNVLQDMEITAEFIEVEIFHRITLNPRGGIVSEEEREVKEGGALGKLPTPTKSGYKFLGWYDSKKEGTKIKGTWKVTKSITLYARWEKSSPAAGTAFNYKSLKYIITKKATAKANGIVQVTGSVNKNSVKVSIPDTVKYKTFVYKVESIKKNAFMNYKRMTILKIGNNVKKIQNGAFGGCVKLRKVTLGTSVAEIGKKVFFNDNKLKDIVVESKKLIKVGKSAFRNIHNNAVIQIPSGKKMKYKNLLKGKGQKKTVVIAIKKTNNS